MQSACNRCKQNPATRAARCAAGCPDRLPSGAVRQRPAACAGKKVCGSEMGQRLAQTSGVKLFVKSFQGTTGLSLKFVPRSTLTASELSKTAIPVRMGGEHVATFLVALAGGGKSKKQFQSAVALIRLFAAQVKESSAPGAVTPTQAAPWCIQAVKDYIHQHYRESIDVPTLAVQAKLCREHLSRVFKKSTGMTILDYLAQVRVQHAQQLLADPNRRIAEAAFAVGFNSIPHFNRVFRKLAGQNPTAYRRRKK